MTRLSSILHAWPLPVAAMMSGAMLLSTAAERVTMPDWLIDAFEAAPDAPEAPAPSPERGPGIPYAPAPGRDDRTPIPFMPQVFGLDDPALPEKLSGVGPVFWDHGGQGSGTLISKTLVLTTGHLFAKRGKWHGPGGLSRKPPAPSDGRLYLEACGHSYDLKAIHMGSMAPRARLGLDYAIAELQSPACDAATVLPVAETPDDLEGTEDQILLNMGAYRFGDLDRYAAHPLFDDRAARTDRYAAYAVFGVRCRATGRDDTGDVADGSTAVIITEGCDGVPGGSGGGLLVSRDGGASYSIIGVANSYRPNTEYNNYTRIEGALAKHLAQFVTLTDIPAAGASVAPDTSMSAEDGPWLPMVPHRSDQEPVR